MMKLIFNLSDLTDTGWEVIESNDAQMTVSRVSTVRGENREARITLFPAGDRWIAKMSFEAFDDSPLAEEAKRVLDEAKTPFEIEH